MKLHDLRLTEELELFTFFVVGPAVGIVVAYRIWRERKQTRSLKQYRKRFVAFAASGILLFSLSKWIDADVRSAQNILRILCLLLSFMTLGIAQGYFFGILLELWRFHKATRLK